ncbi:hypothetical protein ACFFKE_23080 [Streptomyces mutabilis]|nr:hypothetical protein [Streptomyces mutabilis]GGQ09398.1 hypothetical protein GCM10010279_16320 [Streptomyces mutabilis]
MDQAPDDGTDGTDALVELNELAARTLAFEHFARWCVEQRCTLG